MRCHTHSTLEGFIHNFRKSWVSVDHHTQFLYSGSGGNSIGTFLNQISSMKTNNVNSNNFSSFFLEQDLGNTIALAFCQCLTVGTEATLRLAQSPALILGHFNGLFFSGSNHGDFGVSEACGWDGSMIDNVLPSADVFNGGDTMSRRCMSQHHFSVGITNAVQVGDELSIFVMAAQYLHLLVDIDETSVGFNATSLQSHVASVGDTSGGNHCGIDFDRFYMFFGLGVDHFDSYRLFSWNAGRDFRCEHTSSVINGSITDQETFRLFGNLAIKGRHEIIHGLDEGYFGTKSSVHIREFESNVT
mmetsp:Transcript_22935/g.40712  ORF Transcript_22935/g.40712 Transcript_22935/m.40712 type:complete len:302 (-) Transcript_22935:510-1415(-)